jgi:hypothetical protein
MSHTKLEYRVWRQADPMQPGGEILQMKSHMTMADYHFRVNAERAGIDPRGITTEVRWTGETECRFAIAADAPSEALSRAWEKSVALLGLRTELTAGAA